MGEKAITQREQNENQRTINRLFIGGLVGFVIGFIRSQKARVTY